MLVSQCPPHSTHTHTHTLGRILLTEKAPLLSNEHLPVCVPSGRWRPTCLLVVSLRYLAVRLCAC